MGRIIMLEAIIIWLVIGAIAGWLAGLLVKGYGFGLLGNIVVGTSVPSSPGGCCRWSDSFSSAASSMPSSVP
jgi:hypothetical protein